MKKITIFCDYCGKEISRAYTLLPARKNEEDGCWAKKPDYEPYDMCGPCLDSMLRNIAPKPFEKKEKAAAGADPEELRDSDAASKQQEEQEETKEPVKDLQEPVKERQQAPEQDAASKQQAQAKKPAARKVDHGRIVALYKANRSIKWIADDCKCSEQTVVNHLTLEGIYKTKEERRKEKQEESE